MSGSDIMPEYQVWVPWEEVEDLCLISDLINGLVRYTKDPTDELEVALCIPYPKNAPFSVDLFSATIHLLRKALVSNPSYQRHMSQMADFQTWIGISAYFGSDALFEFTLCSVPAKDQCAAILPYIGDLVKEREEEGGNVSECDKNGLIRNMIYRTLHPDTVFDLLKWTIMKDGLLEGDFRSRLSRYLKQLTGIFWHEFAELTSINKQGVRQFSRLKHKIRNRTRTYRYVVRQLFPRRNGPYHCSLCDGEISPTSLTPCGNPGVVLLPCCLQPAHLDCHRELFLSSYSLAGDQCRRCSSNWVAGRAGVSNSSLMGRCTPTAWRLRARCIRDVGWGTWFRNLYLENEPNHWDLDEYGEVWDSDIQISLDPDRGMPFLQGRLSNIYLNS